MLKDAINNSERHFLNSASTRFVLRNMFGRQISFSQRDTTNHTHISKYHVSLNRTTFPYNFPGLYFELNAIEVLPNYVVCNS